MIQIRNICKMGKMGINHITKPKNQKKNIKRHKIESKFNPKSKSSLELKPKHKQISIQERDNSLPILRIIIPKFLQIPPMISHSPRH